METGMDTLTIATNKIVSHAC